MKITDYRFGHITVNGKEYTSDIKIINGRVIPNWWRRQGHLLQLDDVKDIFEAKPQVLVVGTGAAGVMRIDEGVKNKASELGIELRPSRSAEAVENFNSLVDQLGHDKVALAIHLTC